MAEPDGCSSTSVPIPTRCAARDDYEIVKDLHATGAVGTHTPPWSRRTRTARCTSTRTRRPPVTVHGVARRSAVVGILFPPALIGSAIVGAGVGGVGGHLWKGMSRSDVKELGELIDDGEAALLIVGESTLESALDKADLKAEKHIAKELDVSSEDVDQA